MGVLEKRPALEYAVDTTVNTEDIMPTAITTCVGIRYGNLSHDEKTSKSVRVYGVTKVSQCPNRKTMTRRREQNGIRPEEMKP